MFENNFIVAQRSMGRRREFPTPRRASKGDLSDRYFLPRERLSEDVADEKKTDDGSVEVQGEGGGAKPNESGDSGRLFLPNPRKPTYVPLPNGNWFGASVAARSSTSLLDLSPSSSSRREFTVTASAANADEDSLLTSDGDDDDEAFILAAPAALAEERQYRSPNGEERARQRRRHMGSMDQAAQSALPVIQQNRELTSLGAPFLLGHGSDLKGERLIASDGDTEGPCPAPAMDVPEEATDMLISAPNSANYTGEVSANSNDMTVELAPVVEHQGQEPEDSSRNQVLSTPPPPMIPESSQLSPPLLSFTRSSK